MEQKDFVVVYRAPNEATANIVKMVLEDVGISALVRPCHTSWLDGAMVPAEGYWGEVLVTPEHIERARVLLDEYAQGDWESAQEVEE